MYTYDPHDSEPVDQFSMGVGAMVNAVFPMQGGLYVYGSGSVAYDFYHVTSTNLDEALADDPDAGLGILVFSVSAGVSMKL